MDKLTTSKFLVEFGRYREFNCTQWERKNKTGGKIESTRLRLLTIVLILRNFSLGGTSSTRSLHDPMKKEICSIYYWAFDICAIPENINPEISQKRSSNSQKQLKRTPNTDPHQADQFKLKEFYVNWNSSIIDRTKYKATIIYVHENNSLKFPPLLIIKTNNHRIGS